MGFRDLRHRQPGEPFGFITCRPVPDRYDELDDPSDVPDDCWAFGLPHQCDNWAIGMSEDREAVLAEARRFRAELDEAIAVLEAG
jgi:hypothetical protein